MIRPPLRFVLSSLAATLITSFAYQRRADAAPLGASPGSVTFADTPVGLQSPDQTVTYTNTGNQGVTVTALSFGGADPADFVLISPIMPPFTLAPSASIAITVAFRPTGAGARTGMLTAAFSGGAVDAQLAGNGIGPRIQVSPDPINSGGVALNVGAPPVTVAIANVGGGQLHVRAIILAGFNSTDFSLNNVPAFPAAVGPSSNFIVVIGFHPSAAGVRVGTLTVQSDDAISPTVVVPIRGTGGSPAISLGAGAVSFGGERVGRTSAPQTVGVTNSGFADLHVTMLTVAGANPSDFPLDKMMLPGTLAPGVSFGFTVTFAPTALGMRSARVAIASDDPANTTRYVVLLGNGSVSTLASATASLDFGSARVYASTPAQTVVLNNTGSDGANVVGLALSGAQSTWFMLPAGTVPPLRVAAGGALSIAVAARPLAVGPGAAVLTLMTDDAATPSFAVPLAVKGTAGMVTVDPPALDFGVVAVALPSPPATVTIRNAGDDNLAVTGFTVTGADAAAFQVGNPPDPSRAIAPGASAAFTVTFQPTAAGMAAAEIDLTTDDPFARRLRLPLDGIGASAALMVTPAALDFGTVFVDTSGAPLSLTLANSGAAALTIASAAISGSSGRFSVDDNGPFTIAPMRSHLLRVSYKPGSAGNDSDTLVITPAGLAPANVPLTGQAVSAQVAIAPPSMAVNFGDVYVGTGSSPAPIGIKNLGSQALPLGAITASDPAFVVDTAMTDFLVKPGQFTSFTISFAPPATTMHSGSVAITLRGSTSRLASISVAGVGIPARHAKGCALGRAPGAPVEWPALLLPAAIAGLLRRTRRHGRAAQL